MKLGRRREVYAWILYDWANSAYSTLAITVLVAYLQRVVFPREVWGQVGPVVWAWGIAISMLLGAVLSPIIGALADAQSSKRYWLAATALTGALAAILMGAIPPSFYVPIVVLFFVANLAFELSLAVYNGFLTEIASEAEMNRVSAWGYGAGYIGGGLALALVMLLFAFGQSLGLDLLESQLRCGLIVMGVWWGLFTLPTVWVLRDRRTKIASGQSVLASTRSAVNEVVETLRNLRSFKTLAIFLLAFLFYNDGVQTVISQASTFALQELDFTETELLGVILMIQFLALPGALAIGYLADLIGQKTTIVICLLIWMGTVISALAIQTKLGFWILGAVVAMILGGTQSVSRAVMGVMTPEAHSAKFFGFFNLSGKATSFLGTFSFGLIVAFSGSPRLAIFGLLPFFILGAILIFRVDVARGISERTAASATDATS